MIFDRCLSLLVFIVTQFLVVYYYDSNTIFIALISQTISLILIWYPNEVDDLTFGIITVGGKISSRTPLIIIKFFGWLLHLVIPVVFFGRVSS